MRGRAENMVATSSQVVVSRLAPPLAGKTRWMRSRLSELPRLPLAEKKNPRPLPTTVLFSPTPVLLSPECTSRIMKITRKCEAVPSRGIK